MATRRQPWTVPTVKHPLVLHVIPGLGTGGAEQMLASLTTARRQEAFAQAVVDLLGGGVLAEKIRAAGVPVYEFGMRHPALVPAAVLRLAGLIRTLSPVSIQSWLYYADLISLWALALSGRRSSTRLYWGIRCSELNFESGTPLLRRAIKLCMKYSDRPDAVIANSFAGRSFHQQIGYRPAVFPVIHNGIDVTRFKADPETRLRMRQTLGISESAPVVIHAARVHPMKDHATLIAIARTMPDITFIAIGSGTDKLCVPANMITLGVRHDMPALYAAADVIMSTSICGEGFPNVIAEGMACGATPLATDVGDAAQIIGDTGVVVAPRDLEAMVAGLRGLLSSDAGERASRARCCRERIVGRFTLEHAVAAFDALHLRGVIPEDSAMPAENVAVAPGSL